MSAIGIFTPESITIEEELPTISAKTRVIGIREPIRTDEVGQPLTNDIDANIFVFADRERGTMPYWSSEATIGSSRDSVETSSIEVTGGIEGRGIGTIGKFIWCTKLCRRSIQSS